MARIQDARLFRCSVLTALVCAAGCASTVKDTKPAAAASTSVGQGAVVIHKAPSEVFEALIDPQFASEVWSATSSGPLAAGQQVRWDFGGGHSVQLAVRAFEPSRRLLWEWGSEGGPRTTVEWLLTPTQDGGTRLGAIQSGFSGDTASIERQARDSTAALTLVLEGMKVFLERRLQLNLVADGRTCRDRTPAQEASVGKASLLIRKPVANVFEAVVDPAVTTQWWFLEGSDRLGPGKEVQWVFPGRVHANISVQTFEPNRRLVLVWGVKGMPSQTMEWDFTASSADATCVTVISSGFTGSPASIANQANYMTGGFTSVLSNMKTFLEHGFRMSHEDYSEHARP